MLFSIDIKPSGSLDFYYHEVVEAPPTKWVAGVDFVHDKFFEYVKRVAKEQSVIWGFIPVEVEISRFFPASINEDGVITSCLRSIVMEWTEHEHKRVTA